MPEFLGDETLWWVSNDMDAGRSVSLYGSNPTGIEIQTTVFAFKNAPYNTMFFVKKKLINKSGLLIKDMYVSQWSDPDLGGAGDDGVGCDPTIKLGFCYNGDNNDSAYGTDIPAIGYVFLQTPLIPGNYNDAGISNGKIISGKKNIPLSSFIFYIGGGPAYLTDPPMGTIKGSEILYNYQQGLNYFGTPFPSPFAYTGDPENNFGDLDGTTYAFNDRRLLLSAGPFNFAPNDTQEIVIASVIGKGTNNLNSVTVLKQLAGKVQSVYSNNFFVPEPISNPIITATELDHTIILDWSDPAINTNYEKVENYISGNYEFEGYQIYQMPSAEEADISKGVQIGSFDKINDISTISGSYFEPKDGRFYQKIIKKFRNNGLKRYQVIKNDSLTNSSLINNREYYFKVVTIAAYNPSPETALNLGTETFIENISPTLTLKPQEEPGQRIITKIDDTVLFTHEGKSTGTIHVKIMNPKVLTGDQYEIFFEMDTIKNSETAGMLLWNLRNKTLNKMLLQREKQTYYNNQNDQFVWETKSYLNMIDGFTVSVSGPELAFTDFLTVSNANGTINPPEFGGADPNHQGFPRELASTFDQNIARQQVIGGAGLGWGIHTNPTGTVLQSVNYDYFIGRVTRNGGNWSYIIPYDFELRFTAAGGKAVNWFSNGKVIDVPFEIWNIGIGTPDDPSDDYRMIPWLNNAQGNPDLFDIGGDHPYSGGLNDPYSDWIYWMAPKNKTPGQSGYDADIADALVDPVNYSGDKVDYEVMARMVISSWNGGLAAPYDRPLPETGTTFRILTTKPNKPGDTFTFQTIAPEKTMELSKTDLKKINVFPNPYLGSSSLERDSYNRFVTFTHLPEKATIRIFTLSGIFVRKLVHEKTQYENWNLKNEWDKNIASGVYIVYVDTQFGSVILKVSVIQPEEY